MRTGPACCRFAVRTSPLVMPAMASDASGNFGSGSQEHQFQDPASSVGPPEAARRAVSLRRSSTSDPADAPRGPPAGFSAVRKSLDREDRGSVGLWGSIRPILQVPC